MVGTNIVPLTGVFFLILVAASAVFTLLVAFIARLATHPRKKARVIEQSDLPALETAKAEIKGLKEQLRKTTESLQTQETLLQETRTDLSASQKYADGLGRRVAQVQAKHQEDLETLSALRQNEQELAEAKKENDALKEELAKFRIKHEVACATIETLKNEIKDTGRDHQENASHGSPEIQENLALKEALSETKKKAEEQAREFEKRLSGSQDKYESLKRETAARQEELEKEISKGITTELELKDELKELEAANAETEAGSRQLKAALKQEGDKARGLENEKQELAKELESVKKLLEAARQAPTAPAQPKPPIKAGDGKGNGNYDPLEAWIRRFSLGHLGERIWITRDEFESLEEEIKKKNALIENSQQRSKP